MDPTTADAIAQVVASLRPIHDDLALPDTAEIQHAVKVSDGRGGATTTWETVETVRCLLEASGLSGREVVVGSVETTDLPYTVTLPYDTDVTTKHRLVISGRTFEVTDVKQGEGYEVAVTLTCREVTS